MEENMSSVQSEQLMALLAQQVEDHRTNLVGRYLGVLQESLFSNTAHVRPNILKNVAADEVEVLLRFLKQARSSAAERGEQLHQAGFHVRAALRLGQVTRQFLLKNLGNHQIAPVLEIVDAYEMAVVEGFVQSMDNTNKIDRKQMERVIAALQQRVGN